MLKFCIAVFCILLFCFCLFSKLIIFAPNLYKNYFIIFFNLCIYILDKNENFTDLNKNIFFAFGLIYKVQPRKCWTFKNQQKIFLIVKKILQYFKIIVIYINT
jgi:hypothetical protein